MHNIDRADVPGVRQTLAALGAVVAEVDRQLRYVWIDNPHPDFDARSVVGKRDDQLLPEAEAEEILALKRDALGQEEPISRLLRFNRSDGVSYYSLFAYPIVSAVGKVEAVLTVGFDVPPPAEHA
jgi:hypothetical protein